MLALQAEQGLNRPHTKGGNGPNGAVSDNCHVLRRGVTKLQSRRPNTLVQTDMPNPAKD